MFGFLAILLFSGVVGFLVHESVFLQYLATSERWVVLLVFFCIGLIAILLSFLLSKIKKRNLIFIIFGILFGAFLAWLLGNLFFVKSVTLQISFNFFFVALGGLYGFHLSASGFSFSKDLSSSVNNYKILDTSVIVDARIADIAEAGFLEGSLVIPEFVLKELQGIADSKDNVKRNRGRHGLDILNRLKKMSSCRLIMSSNPMNEQDEVDHKLLALTQKLNGVLVTVDYNLNKIAHLKDIPVLNVNELANAIKPNVVVGDDIKVLIAKGGKEPEQGVGYFDDGTMVVIEDGHGHIGDDIFVTVTSVFQTDAGRMIFGCLKK